MFIDLRRPLGNGKSAASGIRAPPAARAPVAPVVPAVRAAPPATRPVATSENPVEGFFFSFHRIQFLAKPMSHQPAKISPSVHRPAQSNHHSLGSGDHHHHGGHNDSYRLQQEVNIEYFSSYHFRKIVFIRSKVFKKWFNSILLKLLDWKKNEIFIIKNYVMSN